MANLEKIQAGIPTDLDIGIREIFRILVPGAYALLLLRIFVPQWDVTRLATSGIGPGLAASFFLGLIGYGLRPHERWFPFYLFFQRPREKLNAEIRRILQSSDDRDYIPEYKYFLETEAADVKDRIHYFSSFYYMLEALSLFSVMAAYFLCVDFFAQCNEFNQHWRLLTVARISILISVLLHLGVLVAPHGLKKPLTKGVLAVGVVAAIAALIMLVLGSKQSWSLLYHIRMQTAVAKALALLAVGYVFDRLGIKHWRQIVGEQIVLVNNRAEALRRVAAKWQPS